MDLELANEELATPQTICLYALNLLLEALFEITACINDSSAQTILSHQVLMIWVIAFEF